MKHPVIGLTYKNKSNGKLYKAREEKPDGMVVMSTGLPGKPLWASQEEFDPTDEEYLFEHVPDPVVVAKVLQEELLLQEEPMSPVHVGPLIDMVRPDQLPFLDVPMKTEPPEMKQWVKQGASMSIYFWFPVPGKKYLGLDGTVYTVREVYPTAGVAGEVYFEQTANDRPGSFGQKGFDPKKWPDAMHLFDPSNENCYYRAIPEDM